MSERRMMRRAVLALLALPTVLAGCHDYHWRNDPIQAEADAREQGKHLFIFYKWWLDNDSNRMLGEVLGDSAVRSRFDDTINVLLDRQYPEFESYVSRYGVDSYPASIIVAPDKTYRVRVGYVPEDQFLAFVDKAMSSAPGVQRPAPVP